jgi:hypothetical protein
MRKTMSLLAACLALTVPALPSGEEAGAKALLERAIKAAGGADRLSRLRATAFKAKGSEQVEGKPKPFKSEWHIQGLTQARTLTTFEGDTKPTLRVVNGDKGWFREGDGPTEDMTKEDLQDVKESLYVNWVTTLVPLREKPFRLELLGEARVGKSAAVGLRVVSPRHRPLKLYFDKETALLLKIERRTNPPEAPTDVTEETLCSAYKDVQGTQQPMHVTIRWDGKTVADVQITEMSLHEKLDAKLFARP